MIRPTGVVVVIVDTIMEKSKQHSSSFDDVGIVAAEINDRENSRAAGGD